MQSKLFDHRAISLFISNPKHKAVSKPVISKAILKDDNIDLVVFTSVCEVHLLHLDTVGINQLEIDNNLNRVGNIKQLIRNAGAPWHLIPHELNSEEQLANREACLQEAYTLKDTLNLDLFELTPPTIEPDLFMETLLNCVRNDVISYQSFINKTKKPLC